MSNLIKTDFKRFFRDNCFYAILILLVVFALGTVGFTKLVAADGFNSSGIELFLSALSPSNNVGFIAPLLLAIILIKDYNYGTVRNKIVCGYSKTQIYLSSFIVVFTIGMVTYVLNTLLILGFGSLVFGFGTVTGNAFLFILKSVGIAMIAYSFFLSGIVFIASLTRNIGITIVIGFISVILISLVGSFIDLPSLPEAMRNISKVIPTYQIGVIMERNLTNKVILTTVLSTLAYTVLFGGLGIYFNNKKDIK